MKPLPILALVVLPFLLHAQAEKFDIISYQAPQGWKKETSDVAISFVKINNDKGTWCRLVVYQSINSSGNPANDFSSEWKALVNSETYSGAVQPQPQVTPADGWITNAGGSIFKWQGNDATVVLATISGYGKTLSILVSMNSDVFMDEIEKFMSSLKLEKGEQSTAPVTSQLNTPIALTDKPGVHGITVAITTFNDGWTAQPFADYVKVTKGPITVLLHYGTALTDENRQADLSTWFWDRMIAPRYLVSNRQIFQNEPYTYSKVYFGEGDAKDAVTGAAVYVGLRVLINNGVAQCVEIVAPSATEFRKEFLNQDEIGSMTNYNKFAISKDDLAGQWEESTSSGVNLYNSVTGNYVGMNAVATAATFIFKADGTYSSRHVGASGMAGSMKTFDEKYNGAFTAAFWEVTMTNRWEGKTDSFSCHYEAVRGGRVLHLVDKAAQGMRYDLVKVK